MESIIEWLQKAMLKPVPILDLSPLSGKMVGKLRLSPEQLLSVNHAQALAGPGSPGDSAFMRPRLKRGPGGRPAMYRDSSILLMAVVQDCLAQIL